MLFLQSSELGLPQPLTRRWVCPPLWYRMEGHSRWRERGWESPNSNEGTHTVVLCIYTVYVLCAPPIIITRAWPGLTSLRGLSLSLLWSRVSLSPSITGLTFHLFKTFFEFEGVFHYVCTQLPLPTSIQVPRGGEFDTLFMCREGFNFLPCNN